MWHSCYCNAESLPGLMGADDTMKTPSKVLLTATVVLLVVLGGAGTAYATIFSDRALPRTTVGGFSVAGMTRAEVAASVQQRFDDVSVTLSTGVSVTRSERLEDLGERAPAGWDGVFTHTRK